LISLPTIIPPAPVKLISFLASFAGALDQRFRLRRRLPLNLQLHQIPVQLQYTILLFHTLICSVELPRWERFPRRLAGIELDLLIILYLDGWIAQDQTPEQR
jgi:hypothetical protein